MGGEKGKERCKSGLWSVLWFEQTECHIGLQELVALEENS